MADSAEERILYLLKSRGAQTAAAIAGALGVTSVAARKQLASLAKSGLVDFSDRREAVGRPRRYWALTEAGHGRFPDSHGALTLELITAARAAFGEAGLERLISQREAATLAAYRQALEGLSDLKARLRALAEARSREGYMAEVAESAEGGYLLVENHCPICVAARACQGFCRSELAIFQEVLGPEVTVERVDHLLAGARRCAYRVRAVGGAGNSPPSS